MNNKKAQLSIEKTRYSLYSSGCSTDLQDHLYVIWKPTCDFPLVINSNFNPILPFSRYDQFSVKTHILSTLLV